jgi:hypothetical protein
MLDLPESFGPIKIDIGLRSIDVCPNERKSSRRSWANLMRLPQWFQEAASCSEPRHGNTGGELQTLAAFGPVRIRGEGPAHTGRASTVQNRPET